MNRFTKTELKIIRILLDNEGHPNWDLEEKLHMKPPNVSRSIRTLEKKKVIYCKLRMTTRDHRKSHGKDAGKSENNKAIVWEISPENSDNTQLNQRRYPERPWFIKPTLKTLDAIVNALITDNEELLVSLKINHIKRSGYFKLMVEKHGDKAIAPIKKLEDIIQTDFWKGQNKDLWDY